MEGKAGAVHVPYPYCTAPYVSVAEGEMTAQLGAGAGEARICKGAEAWDEKGR